MLPAIETLQQFYRRTNQEIPADLLLSNTASHINVKQRCYLSKATPYNRRDYYKVCLIIGDGIRTDADTETIIKGSALIFSNPGVPSAYRATSEDQSGFFCLFNDMFLQNSIRQDIKYQNALFNKDVEPVVHLNTEQTEKFARLFTDMEGLLTCDYVYKHDMIRNILQVIILEAIRIQRPVIANGIQDRLISRFFSLLDQQFPVDSPENPLQLTTPASYADLLNVHVNHLNTVVKRAMGKTTSDIIHERIITEAKTLLLNTDWDAAEIAYSLGFQYPSHFNKYFKQHTLTTPLLFRESILQPANI
jgi:AraC family transcriptional activator of pobA